MTLPQAYILTASIVGCVVLYALIEFLIIKYNGQEVAAPEIPRSIMTFGVGPKLNYVVMGDSTSIGQGTEYEHSYAIMSAKHLAQKYTVHLTNVGVSGARVADVQNNQLTQATDHKPDVVLLGVGANDTTHFTSTDDMENSLQQIVDSLKQANPNVRIVMTRSPAMDSVSRFPWLSKKILRHQTEKVNEVFDRIIAKNNLTPALIAEKTRAAFLADPTLTAADNFHPNARGYDLWTPIIIDALDAAIKSPAN